MRLFCKECGCEFHTELVSAYEICPDCATERIKETEEFLRGYDPNSDEVRRQNREFDLGSAVSGYFFIDTYPMFRKLLERKQKGEPLSDCLAAALVQPGVQKCDFYQMAGGRVKGLIKKKGDYCYQQLWKEIRTVFLRGERILLAETTDKLVQQFEVYYRGFCYAYLLDHHAGKEVALLTDFYRPEERKTENLLLTSLNGQSYAEENKEVHYRFYRNGQYVIINTYHAFCKYADYLHENKDLGFNRILFSTASAELDSLFRKGGDINSGVTGQNMSYVVFGNIIVAYRFNKGKELCLEAIV